MTTTSIHDRLVEYEIHKNSVCERLQEKGQHTRLEFNMFDETIRSAIANATMAINIMSNAYESGFGDGVKKGDTNG